MALNDRENKGVLGKRRWDRKWYKSQNESNILEMREEGDMRVLRWLIGSIVRDKEEGRMG